MSLFRDDGIVRTQWLGEADRIMLCRPGGHWIRLRRGPGPRPKARGGAR